MLRVFIVDDESAARRGLRILLKEHADVEVIGEAGSVKEAALFLKGESPDLILLDVEMPRAQGFALKEFIGDDTQIIFVTAHERYAFRAFEIEALDYLLKPVRASRLSSALERVRSSLPSIPAALETTLVLRNQRKKVVVNFSDIQAVTADGDYSHFLVKSQSVPLMGRNIGHYVELLPERSFVRLSRSLLVNISEVAALELRTRNLSWLHLNGVDAPLELGRAATQKARAALARLSD